MTLMLHDDGVGSVFGMLVLNNHGAAVGHVRSVRQTCLPHSPDVELAFDITLAANWQQLRPDGQPVIEPPPVHPPPQRRLEL